MNWLKLHSLSVISEDDIDITFVSEDGELVTHRFSFRPGRGNEPDNGLYAVLGDPDFAAKYRRSDSPNTVPRWPEKLAVAARNTLQEPLPAGETLERMRTQIVEAVHQRFHESRDNTA